MEVHRMAKYTREQLIMAYEDMMYEYGEYDVWEDDILPKLKNKSMKQIEVEMENDRQFYKEREAMGGAF